MIRIMSKMGELLKAPAAYLCMFANYIMPLSGVLRLILLIVLADFISGIVASRIKKIPRSSRRFRKSFSKLLCYFGVIYLFWEFENAVGIQEWLATYKLLAGLIFLVEMISILENAAVITGNNIFLKIVKLIRGKASKDMKEGSLIDDILNEKNNS